jgi:hypothetical protein
LEGTKKAQEEVAALWKELIEARQALANKEANAAQLEDSNGRLNDEMALLAPERRWLLTDGVPMVMEAIWGSREMCDAVTEINRFSNLLGYQQGLQEGWRLRGAGKPISHALHYDPEAQIKLDTASDAFDDVDFIAATRVVALEDAPVGELPAALDQALRSPVRDPAGGTVDAGKKVVK